MKAGSIGLELMLVALLNSVEVYDCGQVFNDEGSGLDHGASSRQRRHPRLHAGRNAGNSQRTSSGATRKIGLQDNSRSVNQILHLLFFTMAEKNA